MISFHLFFVVTMSCENIIIIVHIYGFCLFHWLVEIVCQYYNSCIQYFLVYVFLYVGLQCRMKSGLSSRHNLGLWWENIWMPQLSCNCILLDLKKLEFTYKKWLCKRLIRIFLIINYFWNVLLNDSQYYLYRLNEHYLFWPKRINGNL